MRRGLRLAAGISALLAAAAAPAEAGAADPLLALRELDQRVATVGHRLATGALDLCSEREWQYGFFIHDLSQYGRDHRDAAIRSFGLDRGPAVLALAAGGPAEQAGLRLDDVLLALDGEALPAPDPTASGFAPVAAMLDRIEAAFGDGSAEIEVLRGEERLTLAIPAERGCVTRFQLVPSRELNARADGRYVQLTTAIGGYVEDEAELAAVVAHELAHNILQHRRRLDAAGVSRGFFGNFGRNAGLFRMTEDEADRLSIYILDRAGYDPQAAVRFWRRFGPRGLGLFGSPRHHGWRSRVAAFEEEIAALAEAKAAGRRPLPSFLVLAAAEAQGGD